jgi:Ca2+-transporting ATPase
VARARRAGIRSILVTGDHVATGLAIAREVGIAGKDDRALSGRELEDLSDEELREAVREVQVFGRVRPEHKLRIVRALAEQDEVVAMTGDGVNDAPALKEADIGVAMGISGTDVSKEAADMILADDDYSTLVAAVAEGRRIFENIRKFIRYLLSSNAGEVLTMFAGILGAGLLGLQGGDGGFTLPLLAVQILWINLVTDGAPALALGVDPGEPGLMERPPRPPGEPVIDRAMWWMIGLVGLVMMVGTLFVLDAYLPGGLVPQLPADGGLERARTAAFTTLVLFQLANVFNCLSATESLLRVGPFRNRWLLGAVALSLGLHALVIYWPPLQRAFETTALTAFDWLLTTGVALTVLVAGEAAKAALRRAAGRS